MRISLLPAVLLVGVASCVAPPQQGAFCPYARQALAAEASTAAVLPWPFSATLGGPRPGRFDLSNFTFAVAAVEAIVTPYADCALHPGIAVRRYDLPLNATWTIATPPGSDVCWRRLAAPPAESGAERVPVAPAPWNRAYTGAGRLIDAQL